MKVPAPVVCPQMERPVVEERRVADHQIPPLLNRDRRQIIGMIDGDECVDAGLARRLKFVARQLALELGQHAEINALQAERRLFQVDERDAGNGDEDPFRRLHDAGDAGMAVQGNAHRHSLT